MVLSGVNHVCEFLRSHTWRLGIYWIISCVQTIVEDSRLGTETESDQDELSEDAERINTVMFYSITSTQKGNTSLISI